MEIYQVANRTASAFFEDKGDAEKWAGACGTAAGMIVIKIDVIPRGLFASQQSNPADAKPVCAFDNGDGILRCSITGNPIGTDTVSRR